MPDIVPKTRSSAVAERPRVSIALYYVPFSSCLTLNNIVILKSRLGITQGRWKRHHSVDCIRVPIGVQ